MLDTPENRKELETEFPLLASSTYEVTSEDTPEYNCIAWAAGDSERWWQAYPVIGGCYWPPSVERKPDVGAYERAFKRLGYRECADGAHEEGFEKVALYGDENGWVQHAARQTEDGSWTSKMGQLFDIAHATPEDAEVDGYGEVVKFMRRRVRSRPHPRALD